MVRIPGVRRAWNLLLRRKDVSRAVEEELEFHLEMTRQKLLAAGLGPDQARSEAERRFGDCRIHQQRCIEIGERRRRARRRRTGWHDLTQDLRFALRGMRRAPVLSLAGIGTLALGIGGLTAMFGLVSHILLAPLPYREPERIVALEYYNENMSFANISEAELWDFRREARSLDEVAVIQFHSIILGGDDHPELVWGIIASGDLFSLLGRAPLKGRWFTSQDARPGAPAVAVISHRLWRDRLGGADDIIGQEIMAEGMSAEVIGVMPQDFYFPSPGQDFWVPLRLDPANPEPRNNHRYRGYARLSDGVGLEEARAEIRSLGERMVAAWPQYYLSFQPWFDLRPLSDQMVGATRLPLLTLLGAVFFILLIAGANVAGLQLARGEMRRHEFAIRGALGGSRGRMVRLILVENLLLALVGGLVGLGIAWSGIHLLSAGLGATLPRIGEVHLDLGVLLFTLVLTLGVGTVFGLLPALRVSRQDPGAFLQEGGRTLTPGRRRLAARKTLVAVEVALAFTLSVGAGVMLRSLSALQTIGLGFETRDRLALQVYLPTDEYPEAESEQRARFYLALADQITRRQGVQAVAVTEDLPLARGIGNLSIQIAGQEVETVGEAPTAETLKVSCDWFETMGIPLVQGRLFSHDDRIDTPPVAVVNETMAQVFWPEQDAIGQRVRMLGTMTWMEVVGIVGDVRTNGLLSGIRQQLYVPITQAPVSAYSVGNSNWLVIHGSPDPAETTAAVREEAAALSGGAVVGDARRMESVLSNAMMVWRVPTHLLGLFGAVALLLTLIGTYGLVVQAIGQQKHEIGIRVALGAGQACILKEASRSGAYPAALGIVGGLLVSLVAGRVLVGMLYGVGPMDPPTYISVVVVLGTAVAVATLLPAARVLRIDPAAILREDR